MTNGKKTKKERRKRNGVQGQEWKEKEKRMKKCCESKVVRGKREEKMKGKRKVSDEEWEGDE